MNDALRKTLLFGIGTFHLTREKVEKFVDDLQKDGQLDPEEGKKLVKDALTKVDEYVKKSEDEIDRIVKKVVLEIKRAGKRIEDIKEEEIVEKVKKEMKKETPLSAPKTKSVVKKKVVKKTTAKAK